MQLVADLHVHSIASGHAYSTITENARAGKARGLAAIAITDHGPALPGAPHLYHFGNMKVLPPEIEGIRVLHGVEANVMDRDGKLDVPEFYLARLDIVLAGLHTLCSPYGSVEENTRMLIKAIEHPWVDVIVHPGNPEYEVDLDAVVKAAAATGTALEINNSSLTVSRKGSESNCHLVAKMAVRHGALLMIGTDSHYHEHVGNFSSALSLISDTGVTEELVINTSMAKVEAYLKKRHLARRDGR